MSNPEETSFTWTPERMKRLAEQMDKVPEQGTAVQKMAIVGDTVQN